MRHYLLYILEFKVHTCVPVVIRNSLRAAPTRRYAKSYPPPQPPSAACSLHAYSYLQQSGRSIKTMNAKNTKKSPIHENANITCDFGDIRHSRSRLPHGHTVSSIIVRCISVFFNCTFSGIHEYSFAQRFFRI